MPLPQRPDRIWTPGQPRQVGDSLIQPAGGREAAALSVAHLTGRNPLKVLDQLERERPRPATQEQPGAAPVRMARHQRKVLTRRLLRRQQRKAARAARNEQSWLHQAGTAARPPTPAIRSRNGYLAEMVWSGPTAGEHKGGWSSLGPPVRKLLQQVEFEAVHPRATTEPYQGRREQSPIQRVFTEARPEARPQVRAPRAAA